MKKVLIAVFCSLTLGATAQQNILLTQAFWQTAPTVDAVKAEIAKGSNPSQANANAMDAVVMAINAQAPTEAIEFLLAQPGNDVNKLTHDGRLYLHWAANRGNADVVAYLLDKGSKINLEDSHGTTPLLFAASSGQQNTKIYDLFIAHGLNLKKEVNADGANALLLAIGNDKGLALTNYFVAKGLPFNSTDAAGNNAFAYAARAGNIELLKTLEQKGLKPNAGVMLMAAQGGGRRGGGGATLALYQYLESLGANPATRAKNGENALHAVVRKPNQNEVIQYFLAKGVDVNQTDDEGNNVLMSAATSNRDTAILGLLIARTKNLNQSNLKGVTALALAMRSNSPEVARYLIAKGADIRATDKEGNNLAYYVLESYRAQRGGGPPPAGAQGMQGGPPAGGGQPGGQGMGAGFNRPGAEDFDAKLNILKENGLDITAPQQNGNTLYHLAIAKNDISLLKRLQPLGIDINAKNKEGMTALHKAALIAKDDAMLKYLISAGGKKEAVTNFKETAYDLASENETLTKNNVSVNFLK